MRLLKRILYFLVVAVVVVGCGGSGNGSLEELILETGTDPLPADNTISGPSKKMLKGNSSQLLDNLKAQHFQSKVRIIDLPEDDKFNDVESLFQNKTIENIDKPFAQIVSLTEVSSAGEIVGSSTIGATSGSDGQAVEPAQATVVGSVDENAKEKKSKNNTISFELSGSFDYLWPSSYDDNTLKFSSIYYLAGNFFDGVGRDQQPALFLRFKEGSEIQKVLADSDEQIFHIYDDKRTIGLLRNTKVEKIEIKIKINSTGETETITLDLTAEKYFNAGGFEDLVTTTNDFDALDGSGTTSANISAPNSQENESVSGADSVSSGNTSQTNIQVAGVDESDIVKTDGKYIFAIKKNSLVVYDVSGAETSTVTTYNLEVFSDQNQGDNPDKILLGEPEIAIESINGSSYYSNAQWQIYLHDDSTIIIHGKVFNSTNISFLSFDGSALTLKKSFLFKGRTVSTRKIDNKLLLFTQDYLYPKNGVVVPYHFAFTESQQLGLQTKNDAVLASLTVEDFGVNLNVLQLDSEGVETELSFLDEKAIFFNENSGGRTLVKIIQIDVEGDNSLTASGTLVDGAENLYVTKDSLYIWNTSWRSPVNWWVTDWSSSEKTNIYRFGIEDGGVQFHSHAQVSGHIINRFAVSEHNSHFRVATYSWADRASALKVLSIKTETMEQVGEVKDIAPGERLQSTRFVGDKAYLVTFLRTDPLFTIDLSDPTKPEIKGELKITGFSEYLHPIDDGTLLGLGHDATEQGFTKGVQLSSFDVSDMTNPLEVDKVIFGTSGNTIATTSPHAFTWYPTLRIVAFPLKIYETDFSGLAVYKLTAENKLEEVVILKDNSLALNYGDIRRALFIGSKLYYLNNGDILSELDVE